MIDGVLLGAFIAAGCILAAQWLTLAYVERGQKHTAEMAHTIAAQERQITLLRAAMDDMDDYIGERSADEANAEDLWGQG